VRIGDEKAECTAEKDNAPVDRTVDVDEAIRSGSFGLPLLVAQVNLARSCRSRWSAILNVALYQL